MCRRFLRLVCVLSSVVVTLSSTVASAVEATPAERIRVPEGFKVERLHSVPQTEEGSWVNMTPDPKGRLIVSDQYGPLYRITPGKTANDTKVERLKVAIGEAHGLLYAFDSLYVVVNGKAAQGSGLYRLRDTDGDDQFDEVKLLQKFGYAGEHGPHAVILSPDGKSLYVCAGNHTKPPEFTDSRVPRRWQEDHVLPRMWDAGGHAVGIMAPGGWVVKTDPDGKKLELIGNGFRNEFDIAFNPAGELFTFDADMEWDIGSPWYRPTRVCHITSGAEFGWRSGTGKWPAYYPDSLPAAVDIGPGSPTGITFGTGAKFPAKFQQALFVCDWSYGLIYVAHLKPDGSTYTGEFERFATASPLPVTDIVVNPVDGALYFTIGGRRTQSGLYRVTYVGSESTAPVAITKDAGAEARALRHKLEAFHGKQDPAAIDTAWPYLGHADRFVRFAARVAIEHQPAEKWQTRALGEKNPRAAITALVALARCGDPDLQPRLITALNQLEFAKLPTDDQLALLRAYGLAFTRMGKPAADVRQSILKRLDQHFPANDRFLDRELCVVLVYLEAPNVAARTLKLLAAGETQEDQTHFAFCLRPLATGWTLDQRREYFSWFNKTGSFRGGHSFSGFLKNIRTEAIDKLSDKEKEALKDILEAEPPSSAADEPLKQRPMVKNWKVDDLLPTVDASLRGRDFKRGREMFAAAACFKCHRFQREGGIIGPDLTGVGKRFNNQYLLESIIEPSKVNSDQYQATIFELSTGQTVIGRIANANGDNVMVITNMLEPGKFVNVNVHQIEDQRPATTSMMPTGLVDTLTQDEILDLLAFLRSGGDPKDEAFQK